MISDYEINEAAKKLVFGAKSHYLELRRQAGLHEEWKKYEDSYFNGTQDYYNGIARVRIPALHQAVERIVPKMDKVIFPPDGEFFALAARNEDDEVQVEMAEAATALIKQQLIDSKIRSKLIGVYRNLCIYGTMFVKSYWHYQMKKRYRRDEKGDRQEIFEPTIDDPDFYCPSIWDIYADPKDEDLEGAVIERMVTDYHNIFGKRKRKEKGVDKGIYDADAVERVKTYKFEREKDSDVQRSNEIRGMGAHAYGPHEHKVIIHQYWGDVPKWFFTKSEEDMENEEVVEDALVEIAGGEEEGEVLRIIDNPFDHNEKPYIRVRYIKIEGKLYGLGVMSVSIPLEAELNTLRNQLMDMRSFMLKNKWLRDRQAEIPDWQLKDMKNLVIDTSDMQGLQPLRPPDFSASAINSEQNIKGDIYDSTGASPLLSGMPTGGSLDRTAGGIATVVQGGLERFELVVTLFEEELLKQLVKHYWMLDQQFLPEGRSVRVVGKPLTTIDPSEIQFNFGIQFLGLRELGEKEYKINALNILLQNLSPYIPLGLDPIPVVLRFFKLMGMGDLAAEVDVRPMSQLEYSPEGELQLLQMGKIVKIDLRDDHDAYIKAYQSLLEQPSIPDNVKKNTIDALSQRLAAKALIENSPAILSQMGGEDGARSLDTGADQAGA